MLGVDLTSVKIILDSCQRVRVRAMSGSPTSGIALYNRRMLKTPRTPDAKFAERRAELGEAALQTLADLGYARTSLREIAQNSEFSHGVLHYYFTDKVDLITFCVREYKIECATRYDGLVAAATSAPELRTGFADAMAETLCEEPHMHRLWYDLRNQSLFEESFRKDALEIDQVLE